jgi:alpha-glucosidase
MGNHDQRRIASRLGQNKVDAVNMILASLPGASVTYNGEEIGMTDVWISWEQTVDPQGCNTDNVTYDKVSRDPARTPFQWDTTTSAGFSNTTHTWLPVSPDYRLNNVVLQHTAANSHLKVFKELQELRRTHTMKEGEFEITAFNKNVLSILRTLSDHDVYITLANLGGDIETVNLTSLMKGSMPDNLKYILVDSSSSRSKRLVNFH